jgi:hypothetical protein
MGFSLEAKCRAQSAVHKATPLIPLETFYLHAPPPVDERASFVQGLTPALNFLCDELEPRTRPEAIVPSFIHYMESRWDVFSDPRYQGKKSTYPVWFLHMLTYFIATNPGLSSRPPKPQPFIHGPRVPEPLVNHYPFPPDNGFKVELNQQLERIRLLVR